MSVFLYICIVALIGAISYKMAKHKGRDPILWFWLGTLFGVIALIVLYFLKDPRVQKTSPVLEKNPLPQDQGEKKDWIGVWYILDQARAPIGPFSYDDIRSMFKEGSLTASSYLWNEEWPDWKLASDVPGLEKS